MAFCGLPWFSLVFSAFLVFFGFRRFLVVFCFLRICIVFLVFFRFLWFPVVSCGFLCFSVVFCGFLWLCIFLLCAVINALLDKRKGREGVNIFSHLFRLPRNFNHETTIFHQEIGAPAEGQGTHFKTDETIFRAIKPFFA